jgi:serine/threonine protein kinase, bacterial
VSLYGERGIPAATAEPPSPSTEPPPPPTPDQQFLTSLRQIGFKPDADPAALIADGHQVCQDLAHREPLNEVVADIQARAWVNPSQANIETSRKFAMAAIDVYCPQYQASAPPPLLRTPPILLSPK